MSFEATAWASKQVAGSASTKIVLLCLANYASDRHLAYPSVQTIAGFTEQDMKTVRRALDSLERNGLIIDSGKRVGETKQVKVYRLPVLATFNDARQQTPQGEPQSSPKTDTLADAKDTQFSLKDTQKRVAEPITNLSDPSSPSSKKVPPAPKKGCRLPADWKPDRELQAWTHEKTGWDARTYRDVLETFHDHWAAKTGQLATKADWPATWRNWVRREMRDMPTARGPRLDPTMPRGFATTTH